MKSSIAKVLVVLFTVGVGLAYGLTTVTGQNLIHSVINSTSIGLTTPAAGSFTTLNSGSFTLNGSGPNGHYLTGNGTSYVDTAIPSRTCNANGCYTVAYDGTITAWGSVVIPPNGSNEEGASFTFPINFTVVPSTTVSTVGIAGSGDSGTPPAVELQTLTTSGGSVYMARVIVASAGGGNFDNSLTLNWQAQGH